MCICVHACSLSRGQLFATIDYIPPGSSVHGILQAKILEWVAIPSPGALPDPGTEPGSLAWQAESSPPGKPLTGHISGK